ncbi:unnamed protein product [Rhizophagus irregularis]|nr:unnamed protein product [Rhizophagus irregularis]
MKLIKIYKELLKELYLILINTEPIVYWNNYNYDIEDKLLDYINNFLFEYELDPKNLFEILTNDSKNFIHYTSLIGFFYYKGIGCKVDKIKSLEIFDSIKKEGTITETITLRDVGGDDDDDNDDVDNNNDNNDNNDNNNDDVVDNDIKKLNKIISKYFYSLFLYKDVLIYRKDNYKVHIRNAEKGDSVSQYFIGGYNIASFMVGNCYHYGNGILKDEYKAFEWYLKSAKKGYNYCQYIVSNYYNDGLYVKKNEKKGFYWNRKSAINGYIYAQHKLAKYYFDDTINKNQSKALKWYLVLSNKNSFDAIHLVSKCYRDGIGTDRNFPEAIKWFEKTLYY